MNVAVVKYNAGNIYSVVHALRRIGIEPIVTDDANLLRKADKVIFPGVGEASSTMAYLTSKGLDQVIRSLTQPVLGICLGMQLMTRYSEEGQVNCLGIFDTEVRRFQPQCGYKIPHMGWNQIYQLKTPVFAGIDEQSYVYFVHSYYVPQCAEAMALCDYPTPFSAALHKDNFYATQFHPEKSGDTGSLILQHFVAL